MSRASTRDRRQSLGMAVLIALIVVAALCSPHLIRAQPPGIGIDAVASQLGVGLAGDHSGDFAVGVSFTGVATDPAKLEALGIHGAHKGARVTVIRIAQDRILVAVDEITPAPLSISVRLKLGLDGTLSRL
ncbi:MAG: hypothetical protein HOQ11_07235 [Gemmatimonadaceae bacterium]|nr:hypothetical protein [Gemmatimonadaceae bacterium]NUQ93194.1 hypothetical protein [Gemmatimonadaceae bacterium]NUR18897.1 hypothetical protein [Gemmatimonadaceae bacterium]NUS97185.1 hypothetical protein [Gemmatimonadaceae bacterium]